MRHIKFTAYGSSNVYGSFEPGYTLRCSDDVARHFVEAAQAAVYVDSVQAPAQPPAQPPAPSVQPAGPPRPAAKRARRASGA